MKGSIVWLSEHDSPDAFPAVDQALREPDGLLAAGGDLSPARLIAAYRRGIFPWYSRGQPILWWSPDPRAVLTPSQLKISRSLWKSIRNRGYVTRMDTAFREVIRNCSSTQLRPGGTWLSPQMRAAYLRLHKLGLAHSVETWRQDRLVGGLYGVAIGRVFFGESMFSIERDASKVALKQLCDELLARGFRMIDCQMATPHLLSMGAQLIPRAEFITLLRSHVGDEPAPARPLQLDAAACEAAVSLAPQAVRTVWAQDFGVLHSRH
ncbi:leucyl/phenylalanyl-tRNA--protein transferase [Steroidobacter denitrificans]|uniref:Leucyl/phenylalanyl-tRNA--protein transferase n=1 Tax=Steroidobacter denitrificans TaxID=465721 RepID=A0A127F9W8_STEDE|nr:leucyl/phenylalanyl-tRNA--protein transferase [Steroidobacter denitrificans]AMN47212.1 leucyl/phenylalanyl-tRNA--protein transferase [Steroidobacter denitrificans]